MADEEAEIETQAVVPLADTLPEVIGASTGAIGLGPYGDITEHTGEPVVILRPDTYRPFFATDARSVLVTVLPNHYNFIPNPAFRVDAAGWEIQGLPNAALNADSWVGQSVACTGEGSLRYREGGTNYIYVGTPPDHDGPSDYRRGGSEWTFSVYAKGEGQIRLNMDAYYPSDIGDPTSPPEYQNLVVVPDPATYPAGEAAVIEEATGRVWNAFTDPAPTEAPYYYDIERGPAFADVRGLWTEVPNDGEWHRFTLPTRANVEEGNGFVSFQGASWIDGKIEIRSANNLLISSAMLDSTEYPVCAYFDGGMTEDIRLDDFLWEGEENESPSLYYFDRLIRVQWLSEELANVVPVGRPYQIFFGSYWRPFVPSTGETVMMPRPSSAVEVRRLVH